MEVYPQLVSYPEREKALPFRVISTAKTDMNCQTKQKVPHTNTPQQPESLSISVRIPGGC